MSDGPSADKQALRAQLLKRRAALPPALRAQMGRAVAERVLALPAYTACGMLFSYVSVRQEVDTRALIRAALRDGKRVAVPRCEGKRMVFYVIDSLDALLYGGFGLLEPPPGGETARPDARSLCLVPGLAFDGGGARIGYGGGFYDRFLPAFPGLSAGLCYSPLLADAPLPVEPHDCRVDLVVTDRNVLESGAMR